jgi:hypothetical protein
VARQLNAGYRTLAAHLPALVAAFQIPDLAAPIADDYINAWLESAGWAHLDHQLPPGRHTAPSALSN